MEHCTRKPAGEKEIAAFGADSIEHAMRLRIRDTIEELVKEELDAALGASKPADDVTFLSHLFRIGGPVWFNG